jgi:predicted Ser/Thr protein kinase/tetratricopeptide (TPR) repeat protein
MATPRPDRLGRYEILDQIGRGAMGVVYLARDPVIGRLVAIKTLRLLHGSGDDDIEQFRRRFLREAQSAGILSHPNIVTIHDVVDDPEQGVTFIAMEYVRGTNLKELIRRGKALELPFVVEVSNQIAEALDYAHRQGVIHRDIKPANVLLTGDGQVKLTDFGIARLSTSNLTLDHELLGTPNYMAPEQIQGAAVDHRADIFSLGVVVYEMLSGAKPFQGDNLTAVTHKIVHGEFTPLEERLPNLPPGLAAVVERAFEQSPADRHASCRELAQELAACQPRDAAAVPPPPEEDALNETQPLTGPTHDSATVISRPAERPRRKPPLWRVAALIVVTATVALGLGFWGLGELAAPVAPEAGAWGAENRRYLGLLQQGQGLLALGDAAGAVAAFREAEGVIPGNLRARALREQAELQAAAQSDLEGRLTRYLDEARQGLSSQRYDAALQAAEAALALAPGDAVAAELARIATDLKAAEDKRRTAVRRQRGTELPSPPQVPVGEGAETATLPVETGREPLPEPTLNTRFVSLHRENPTGIVAVFVDNELLFRHPYRFLERKGFLGLEREAYDGQLVVKPVEVPAGRHTVRVYVTPRGKAAQVSILEGEFTAGKSHRLAIQLSEAGELTAQIQ